MNSDQHNWNPLEDVSSWDIWQGNWEIIAMFVVFIGFIAWEFWMLNQPDRDD